MIIIDSGLAFPSEDMPGVDLVIQDFTYLKENANKIRGVVITHGHEDHIGSIPYLFKELKVPVFGSKLTLTLLENKFEEQKITGVKMMAVKPRNVVKLGCFTIEFIKVNQEDDLDSITALSGSGPAYVFYFIEAFCKAAHNFGFSEEDALKIAMQTFKGSVSFLGKSDLSCTELRKRVTSKGGTTEAAIRIFDENNVFNSLVNGIDAAQKRSIELGKINS